MEIQFFIHSIRRMLLNGRKPFVVLPGNNPSFGGFESFSSDVSMSCSQAHHPGEAKRSAGKAGTHFSIAVLAAGGMGLCSANGPDQVSSYGPARPWKKNEERVNHVTK
jgi:hypothetical protein